MLPQSVWQRCLPEDCDVEWNNCPCSPSVTSLNRNGVSAAWETLKKPQCKGILSLQDIQISLTNGSGVCLLTPLNIRASFLAHGSTKAGQFVAIDLGHVALMVAYLKPWKSEDLEIEAFLHQTVCGMPANHGRISDSRW